MVRDARIHAIHPQRHHTQDDSDGQLNTPARHCCNLPRFLTVAITLQSMSTIVAPQTLHDHASEPGTPLVVIVLCAEWCGVCREFRPIVDTLAALHPQAVFSWIDIEDDAALLGELDVEDFPTLAIFRAGVPVYFGTTLPIGNVLGQLIRTAVQSLQPLSRIPDEMCALRKYIFAN